MNKQYFVIKRKNKLYTTAVSKQFQTSKEFTFFVSKSAKRLFPRHGLGQYCFYLADFIFADGKLIKNRYGAV